MRTHRCYHGNTLVDMIRSWSNKRSSFSLSCGRRRAGILNHGKQRSCTVNPACLSSFTISLIKKKRKKKSEPSSHWSAQPQAGKTVSLHWSVLTTISHSAAANQVQEQYLWNLLRKRECWCMEINQSLWPHWKNKQEVGGASKPQM